MYFKYVFQLLVFQLLHNTGQNTNRRSPQMNTAHYRSPNPNAIPKPSPNPNPNRSSAVTEIHV